MTDWPGPGARRDGVALAGRYLVGEVVGRGRSAVYRARDQLLGREVALEQVRLVPDPDAPAGTGGRDAAGRDAADHRHAAVHRGTDHVDHGRRGDRHHRHALARPPGSPAFPAGAGQVPADAPLLR